MLVGDIYGGKDYDAALGLTSTTIASSFGKVRLQSRCCWRLGP
jgi:pantothenate kinase